MKILHSLTFAAALALLSVASYGQTLISSVPYTFASPGTYVLANNLSYDSATGAAITIHSANVTSILTSTSLLLPLPRQLIPA